MLNRLWEAMVIPCESLLVGTWEPMLDLIQGVLRLQQGPSQVARSHAAHEGPSLSLETAVVMESGSMTATCGRSA
ncbi:hypothetical protein PC116_g24737 [Phytophthora cactorum]|uniref:Uncharacterized protein n=1 Tax=Phytophthora cactorum TaxID=29920 RepID=A0A8T1JNX0_9STRA|nr:hypothetical protein Pcac1_g7461 [Phytophthora cactorum]KAG2898381.1 hypothetical protein PC117_g22554 [Phytophthora cactorum]KAG4226864.1 hypothetical protein PC116_g24737 [Phytophthora cactorum]